MSFYTVRMKRKRLISTFGTNGKKTGERTELVDEVYHDLPYLTALGYKEKFPDSDVVIEQQAQEMRSDPRVKMSRERESHVPRAERTKIGGFGTPIAGKPKTKKIEAKSVPGADATYADAINKVLESA